MRLSGNMLNWLLRQPLFGTLLVIGTGQSLSVGDEAAVRTIAQPYSNLKLFDSSGTYDITNPSAGTLSAVPLVAPQRPTGSGTAIYPGNIGGESIEIAFANQLTALALGNRFTGYKVAASCTGQGGAAMSVIQKGGTGNAYAAGIYETAVFKRLLSGTFGAACVLLTHGEADAESGTTQASYLASLQSMQASYQADCSAITGQSRAMAMVFSQQNASSPTWLYAFDASNTTAAAMLQAAQSNPALFCLSGPKYQYPYFVDHTHLTDYRPAGEKAAQAYFQAYELGLGWAPLWPTAFARAGQVVTITFHVPVAPLVWDGNASPPHIAGTQWSMWAPGKGFEAYDGRINVVTTTGNGVSPIVVTTSTPHGRQTGDKVGVSGVRGNTNANGVFTATVIDATHLSLNGTTGNAAWFQGGQVMCPIPITSAIIQNGNQVAITLGRAPAADLIVSYADQSDYTAYNVTTGGFGFGRCGLLRDSDPFVGLSGVANQNWCVEFLQAVA